MFTVSWILQKLKENAASMVPTVTFYHDGIGINNRNWRLRNIPPNIGQISAIGLQILNMLTLVTADEANQVEEYLKVGETHYKFIYEKAKFLNEFNEQLHYPGNKYNVTIVPPNHYDYEKISSWDLHSEVGSITFSFLYRACGQMAEIVFEELFDKDLSKLAQSEQSWEALEDLLIAIIGLGTLCGMIVVCTADYTGVKMKLADWMRNRTNPKEVKTLRGLAEGEEEVKEQHYGAISVN